MLTNLSESEGTAMKVVQIASRDGVQLLTAMNRKQTEIRRGGRGTFSRAGSGQRTRWTHVRYRGSIRLKPGLSDTVQAAIKSPERGDEARLLSSFLGRLDRHFGKKISSVNIQYR
jgi:hypothetical protein